MNTLRRIDWYGQVIMGSLMILSLPFLFCYGFLAGLFVLGGWQLLSAATNTVSFVHSGFRKEIAGYWIWVLIVFAVFFPGWVLSEFFGTGYTAVTAYMSMAATPLITFYYLRIYKKLVDYCELRNELSGFTKSKR